MSPQKTAGYILLEMSVVFVIVAYSIVTLIVTLGLVMKAGPKSEQTLIAAALAEELLEEVQMRKWDETSEPTVRPGYPTFTPSTIGADVGESTATKTTFDDVDDFSGWAESVVLDPLGNSVTGFTGFTRSVTVSYVSSATLAVSVSTTEYKLVTACAQKGTNPVACLNWVSTNK